MSVGLPVASVPVDGEGRVVPAYMWVLLSEFGGQGKKGGVVRFSFPVMMLACALFDVFSVECGVVRSVGVGKQWWDKTAGLPDREVLGNFDPVLPFPVSEVGGLTSWPVFLLSPESKVLVRDFVTDRLWAAVCARFGLGSSGGLSDSASKFLLNGGYWLSSVNSGEDVGEVPEDWGLLAGLMVDGGVRGVGSLASFPAWVYVACLFKKNLLSDEVFYYLVSQVFLLELVVAGLVVWKCGRWRRWSGYSGGLGEVWVDEKFLSVLWQEEGAEGWLMDRDALAPNVRLKPSASTVFVGRKLFEFALSRIGAGSKMGDWFNGTGFLNRDAKEWFDAVSSGVGWDGLSEDKRFLLRCALGDQGSSVASRVSEIVGSVNFYDHYHSCSLDCNNRLWRLLGEREFLRKGRVGSFYYGK